MYTSLKKYINKANCLMFAILIIIVILCYRLFYIESFKGKKSIETFTDKKENKKENKKEKPLLIISNWDNGSGFYSEMGFKLNHYLYCKKYKINFSMQTTPSWPYTLKDGWIDYFEDVKLTYNIDSNTNTDENEKQIINGCCTILEQFPLSDYVAIIPEFYKYNDETKKHINKIKEQLDINNKEYGAVYIRRGDKLVDETKYIESKKFADMLINKMPDCKILFVQTDDYNSYIDIKNYIENDLKKGIKVLTTCPADRFGTIAHSGYTDKIVKNDVDNSSKDYMNQIKDKLSKPIAEMNIEERKEHTLELLTGIDICMNAKYVICDFKSNVSRFIKIAHRDFYSVFDVSDEYIDISEKKCPAFDFTSPHQNV
jgi:hypothetical protein